MSAGEEATSLILELRGNSLDDGPGIRTVVFFKGCPLRCAWCHNPESQLPRAELSFDAALCVSSGDCVKACPEGALSLARGERVDRQTCTRCMACVPACPSGALSIVGATMGVDEVVAKVLRDQPFFIASGGGATLSGGEPAMFPAFAGALAQALRGHGVHVLLETCGAFDLDVFDRHLYPHLDAIYFDLKVFDDALHRELTGAGNARILDNFAALLRRARQGGVEVLPRIPLVPGMTATDDNLRSLAAFLRAQGAKAVSLLPYNPLWGDKAAKVGRAGPPHAALTRWMKTDEVARCEAAFAGFERVT